MRQSFLMLICFAFLTLTVFTPSRADDKSAEILGKRIADVDLKDYLGTPYRLRDATDSRVVVVAFLGTECPLAKLYAARLVEVAKTYTDQGVTVWASTRIARTHRQRLRPTHVGTRSNFRF